MVNSVRTAASSSGASSRDSPARVEALRGISAWSGSAGGRSLADSSQESTGSATPSADSPSSPRVVSFSSLLAVASIS